ncbi:hypothetical protein Poli38472_004599 [Pythium oligandrum]|uniref:Sterol 3-beta-glucosyltransferase n=1 Tax=Pythium oligandrum TaxID=41045 RepID=A0A8K1CAJ3_PYTOL|nr:hypothetical protein Poli38472_004599 [Pythium oligandrum]|eukprot:TMW59530.1 hypothetical protein Poli38472_004599 [Pythium oligandrum]
MTEEPTRWQRTRGVYETHRTRFASKAQGKIARVVEKVKDTERSTRAKIGSLALAVHGIVMFDENGRIKLHFDGDDDKYDISSMLEHDKAIQRETETFVNAMDDVVPQMNVCIMIVGTRGDVQPFIGIAKRLQQDGHRVRLATHAVYRDFVMEHGVEFYPLGGDPKELAAYMVKTGGSIIPLKIDTLVHDVPRNVKMVEEILNSTWPAVSAADPDANGEGIPGKPFRANAIISNPVTYGHIHVAERLGVPLHIMFPQPWVPTTAFPHPMSNLAYNDKPQKRNYISYKLVDMLMWQGTEGMVNRFRTDVLGLRKIRKGDGGRDMLLDLAIPHAFMWSPALVPKPADWGHIYDVIGTVQLKGVGSTYSPTPELERFLGNDGGPIFVGFGSMILSDPVSTTKMIIEAATQAQVRVLIQSSWSDMAGDIKVPSNVFFLGNCPHDWLMPRVSAVVHHGGAGTTAAGLLAGKPTFIVPFFGDQPFWGRAVVKTGVGVEPCPIGELTMEKLRDAFVQLTDPEICRRAEALGRTMSQEDGVEEAVRCFYRHLPLKHMRCDIDGVRLATKWSTKDKIRLCDECESVISVRPENSSCDIIEYHCVDYSARGPNSLLEGASSGTGALLHELGSGIKDVFVKPARGYREEGAKGAIVGLGKGIVSGMIVRPIQGTALLADHVATGRYNKSRLQNERKRGTYWLENKRWTHGSNLRPDAHSASMKPDEDSLITPDQVSVSVHLANEDRQRLEDRFHQFRKNSGLSDRGHPSPASVSDAADELREYWASKDELVRDLNLNQMEELGVTRSRLNTLKFDTQGTGVVPKMTICMLAIGTWRENVQQFVAIGVRLLADGHRVRVAAHEQYRERIVKAGLEFYPIGGAPLTVKHFILYQTTQENRKRGLLGLGRPKQDFPELEDLVFSLWPACVGADPSRPRLNFRADVIITHPHAFGQTIVAERLGVPLHVISNEPWSPTQAFAHPMSESHPFSTPYAYKMNKFATYNDTNQRLWDGMRDILDDLRSSLGLHEKTKGCNLLADWRTPHTYLWDESLLPKPLDWGNEIAITGPIVWDGSTTSRHDAFIQSFFTESAAPVIYACFDEDTLDQDSWNQLVDVLDRAAIEAKCRVLLQCVEQKTYTPIRRSSQLLQIASDLSIWDAMPRFVGAIHCGDATISSACAAVGVPACIVASCPAQNFWGKVLVLAGAGIEPLDATQLSVSSLARVFLDLQSPTLATKTHQLSKNVVSGEAAIEKAVQSFYASLPVEAMTCDLDPTRTARIYDQANELKLSYEALLVVQSLMGPEARADIKYKPLQYSQVKPPRYSLRAVDPESPKNRLECARDESHLSPTTIKKALFQRQPSRAERVIEAQDTLLLPRLTAARIAEINATYELHLEARTLFG